MKGGKVRNGDDREPEVRGDRVPTGVDGLDTMTGGGLPRGTVNLVSGPTGCGKTLLGLGYLVRGATVDGELGLYLTLEETRESLLRAAEGFEMDIRALEEEERLVMVDMARIREHISAPEDGRREVASLEAIGEFLSHYLVGFDARRLVIDSVTAAGIYTRDPDDLRQELFRLCNFLRESGLTTIMITDVREGGGMTRYDVEQFLADSFILMELEDMGKGLRRAMMIRKMRYTDHDVERHPYMIGPGGIQVMHGEVLY